jgi:hypothetical protein
MGLTQVSTDGVKNDAITKTKIPANQIEASELASSAVTNVKIAAGNVDNTAIGNNQVSLNKLVQGTSSNDGKFLRANNGADPSFESVPSPAITGINGAGNTRLITSDGGTTVTAADSLTFDGQDLSQTITVDGKGIVINAGNIKPMITGDANRTGAGNTILGISGKWNGTEVARIAVEAGSDTTNKDDGTLNFSTTSSGASLTKRMVIDSSGNVGINETSPQQQLHVHDDTAYNGILINGNGAPRIAFAKSTTTTGEWSAGIDGTNGDRFCINNSNDNSANYIILDPNSSHKVILCENTQVNGDLKFGSSGNGIDFSADGNASGMSSEKLDDYEEGSWAPQVHTQNGHTNATYHYQQGYYTRIGRIVYAHGYIHWSGATNHAGYIYFNNFPFSSANISLNNSVGNVMLHSASFPSGYENPVLYMGGNSPGTNLYYSKSGSGWVAGGNTNAGEIIFSITYLAT